MNYLNREDQNNLFNKQVEYYQNSIKDIETVKAVVKSFDNKVLNIKFNKALPENYSLKNAGIEYYDFSQRSIRCSKGEGSNYIFVDTVYMGKYSGIDINHDESYLTDGNRIIASVLINQLDLSVIRINKLIETMKAEYKKIDELQAQKEELLLQIANFNNSVSYTTADYFNLKIDVKR